MKSKQLLISVLGALGIRAVYSQTQGSEYPSPPSYPPPWMSPDGEWIEAYNKAATIVSQLTLLEKVNLTTATGMLGGKCLANTGDIPRLGIHGLCLADTPVFIAPWADFLSAFPAGVNVGATWDRNLAYLRGLAMGAEWKGKGADVLLRPAVGPLGRFPDGGRNWEGFSPDPYLSGEMVGPTIRGIQENGIMATVKHYIANEQEHFRQTTEAQQILNVSISEPISSNLDDKTMHEIYLWPFANAVKAGIASVMCSYNQINNSASCQNSYTLNHLLKQELGFQGFVLSDWGAQHSGVSSAFAGLDMATPGDTSGASGQSFWGANMTLAVLNGTLPEWRLDDMCMRIMSAYFQVGVDQSRTLPNYHTWQVGETGPLYYASPNSPIGRVNEYVAVRQNHKQIIRDIGASSLVLLKNLKGALPLTGEERLLGLFGNDAGSNPYGVNGCHDRGCNNGTLGQGWGSGSFIFPYLITPEQALTHYVTQNTGGAISTITNEYADVQIANLASQATASLVFVNSNSGEGYLSFDGNYGDRKNLTLWGNGETLIKNVSAICNNTIVVIHSGGTVLVNDWYDHPNVTAIIWAGMPGQESGNSLVDVLYGQVSPSGKLPFTIGASHSDYGVGNIVRVPNNGNNAPQVEISGLDLDYRHFDRKNITPIYEFGFGLSYTTFKYSDLEVSALPGASIPYQPFVGKTSRSMAFEEYPKLSGVLQSDQELLSKFTFPEEVQRNRQAPFIYPYLETDSQVDLVVDNKYGLHPSAYLPDGHNATEPQTIPPAGGGLGGNPMLWCPLYTVRASITNTGEIGAHEVAQLYIRFSEEPDQPPRVLRSFDRLFIATGEKRVFEVQLLRRDVSTWDVTTQDWKEATSFEVFIGSSSRNLPLHAHVLSPRIMT